MSTPTIDLDGIAKRILIARELFGDTFDVGDVELETGQLTPRPTIDILRDRDRLALFDEVVRLRHQQRQARALLVEGLQCLTDHETTLERVEAWIKNARRAVGEGG